MHAIDGENLKRVLVNTADPAVAVGGFAIPRLNVGITKRTETRLPSRELIE
jgi:hypothetical protein